jgi:hypothetical protein
VSSLDEIYSANSERQSSYVDRLSKRRRDTASGSGRAGLNDHFDSAIRKFGSSVQQNAVSAG